MHCAAVMHSLQSSLLHQLLQLVSVLATGCELCAIVLVVCVLTTSAQFMLNVHSVHSVEVPAPARFTQTSLSGRSEQVQAAP